jgi:HAD superfamily phosphoserine phosphatase-like hydrolase
MVKQGSRPFAAFDIDGTLVRWQLYHAIADELVKLGYIDAQSFSDVKDARMLWKKRTEPNAFKDYELKLVRAYEKLLLDLPVKHFHEAVGTVFEQYKDQVYTYTRDLISQLKKDNYLLFAISNSQIEIVRKIADYYGFDDSVGTLYYNDGQRFTGEETAPLGTKHKNLETLVKKHRTSYKGSLAVGDSTSDITMLEAVEKPIAFNPEKALFDHARKNNWLVVVERKNMVYKFEAEDDRYVLA